jgi:hypothetical protein
LACWYPIKKKKSVTSAPAKRVDTDCSYILPSTSCNRDLTDPYTIGLHFFKVFLILLRLSLPKSVHFKFDFYLYECRLLIRKIHADFGIRRLHLSRFCSRKTNRFSSVIVRFELAILSNLATTFSESKVCSTVCLL